MRQPKIMTAAALTSLLLAVLIGMSPTKTPEPVSYVEPAPVRAVPAIVQTPVEPVKPTDDSIHLSGIGDPNSRGGERSETVYLKAGTYNIRVTHDGTGFFSMGIFGVKYRDIIGQVGHTDATVTFTLAEGEYWFGFQADGRWTVTVTEVK